VIHRNKTLFQGCIKEVTTSVLRNLDCRTR